MFQIHNALREIKESEYRCDQCEKAHCKCDKGLPSCTTCIKSSKECSYLNFIDGPVVKFKYYQKKKIKQIGTSAVKDDIADNKYNRLNNFKMIKFLKGNNVTYELLDLFNRFHRRDSFENLMTLFQFPSPNKLNSGFSIFLALSGKVVEAYFKKITAQTIQKKIEVKDVPNLEKLKDKAIDNYFKYNNTILPIFIKSKFNFNSKSEILKMTIIIVGLTHMKKDEQINYLYKVLSYRLEKVLRDIHHIKPTLENIQALIILMISCIDFFFITSNMDIYLTFCQRASDLIGLHLTPPGLTKSERIERDMTCSSLCVIYLFYRTNIGFYFYLPYKPRTLDKEYNLIIEKATKVKGTKINIVKHSLNYCFNIYMSSYNNNLSSILFSLRLLKERYLNTSYKEEDLSGTMEILIKRLEHLKNIYLLVFSKINTKLTQSNEYNSEFNYMDFILFIHHLLRFYIYSFKLYYPIKGNISACHLDYIKDNDFITKILMECELSVHHGIRISSSYLNRFNVAYLTQCLTFLIRYKHHGKDKFNSIILKGINYIKELSKIERYTTNAMLNLDLLDFIENHK